METIKYYKHPLEDCLVKVVVNTEKKQNTIYLKFAGENEYMPKQESNIVNDFIVQPGEQIKEVDYIKF